MGFGINFLIYFFSLILVFLISRFLHMSVFHSPLTPLIHYFTQANAFRKINLPTNSIISNDLE